MVDFRSRREKIDAVIKVLSSSGVKSESLIANLQRQLVDSEQLEMLEFRNHYSGDVPDEVPPVDQDPSLQLYHAYKEITDYLNQLSSTYHQLMKLSSIGQTCENRSIPLAVLSADSSEDRTVIVCLRMGKCRHVALHYS